MRSQSSWSKGQHVSLEVADTPDPELIGRRQNGVIERLYEAKQDRTEGALVILDAPLSGNEPSVLVLRRNRPTLVHGSQFVYVIPWSASPPDDETVDPLNVSKHAIFIAEIKLAE